MEDTVRLRLLNLTLLPSIESNFHFNISNSLCGFKRLACVLTRDVTPDKYAFEGCDTHPVTKTERSKQGLNKIIQC